MLHSIIHSLDTEDAEIQTFTNGATEINQLWQNVSGKENEVIRLSEVMKGIDSRIQRKKKLYRNFNVS